MALLLSLTVVFLSGDAVACSGLGTVCTSSRGLPGTCTNIPTAGTCTENPDPDGTCTFDHAYDIDYPAAGTGIVSTIIANITGLIQPIANTMFQSITSASGFTSAAKAAITLYVIVYAISFTFGMVQLTLFDFFVRMVKISVVAALVNGTAWGLFSSTFIHFFNDGTNTLIAQVSTITTGGVTLGGQPFDWIDRSIAELTSAKMMVTLMAAAATGPYGWVIIILLGIGLISFVKAMLSAIWVYLMALVLRTLLFGLAPLFLACVMFSRTRQLFDGWLNQVVNSCLQPIFLFAFFSFFIQLIKTMLDQVVSQDVCWTEVALFDGAPDAGHYWRFATLQGGVWEPYDGVWGYGDGHPLGIMLPLTIWLMADLATRFNEVVIRIAKDIANAATSFKFEGGGFGGGGAKGGGGGGDPKKPPGATPPKPPRPPKSLPNGGKGLPGKRTGPRTPYTKKIMIV